MTRPNCLAFSAQGGIHGGTFTLSRISTRSTASVVLSGGKLLDDCSARNVAVTMKGISCDSTPSFARSSGVIGGKSDEGLLSSVGYAQNARDWDSSTLWDLYSGGHTNPRTSGG